MKIKKVTLAADDYERVTMIFKQLGAKEKLHNGQEVLSIVTTPEVMDKKVEIAFEMLKRIGYDRCSQSLKHFWFISDLQKKLDTISIESQGSSGFVRESHEYLIYW